MNKYIDKQNKKLIKLCLLLWQQCMIDRNNNCGIKVKFILCLNFITYKKLMK